MSVEDVSMPDKYLYDKDGKYSGKISDESPDRNRVLVELVFWATKHPVLALCAFAVFFFLCNYLGR